MSAAVSVSASQLRLSTHGGSSFANVNSDTGHSTSVTSTPNPATRRRHRGFIPRYPSPAVTAPEAPTQLPATDYQVTMLMQRVSPVQWAGACQCVHGTTRLQNFIAQPESLNPLAVVQSLRGNHDLAVHCYCPYAPPTENATVTFNVASSIQPGQLRLIPQASASTPFGNFFFGPPLTCARLGAYQLDLTLVVDKNPQSISGNAQILLDRVVVASALTQKPKVGEPPTTTVTVNAMTNIRPGQFVLAAYENLSGPPLDVIQATFTLGAVWVP